MRRRILFLAHLPPWPLDGGGQIKSHQTLEALAGFADVALLTFVRRPADREALRALEPLCALGVRAVDLPRGRMRDLALAVAGWGSDRPWLVARDDLPAMRALVAETLAGGAFDALHVDHLQMAVYAAGSTMPRVLDQHNVESLLMRRMGEARGGLWRAFARHEAARLEAFETDALRRADRVVAVSETDARTFRTWAPDTPVAVVPIGIDTAHFAPARGVGERRRVLSIGTLNWPPNVDGLRFFCADVWPRVRARFPDAVFDIVGARPGRTVRALGRLPGVRVHGSVPDIRPHADGTGVFVAPLRAGSGMRVQILTALSLGLPVTTSPVGAEGIALTDGGDARVVEGADAWVEAVTALLADPAGARRMGAAGRALAEARHDHRAAASAWRGVYGALWGEAW